MTSSRAERRRAGQPGSANHTLAWTLAGGAAWAGTLTALEYSLCSGNAGDCTGGLPVAAIAMAGAIGGAVAGASAFAADRGVNPLLTIGGAAGAGAGIGELFHLHACESWHGTGPCAYPNDWWQYALVTGATAALPAFLHR